MAMSGSDEAATQTAACTERPRNMALRRLWARMASGYGHRWTSAFGVSPEHEDGRLTLAGDTWANTLAGLSEQQIAEGLRVCRLVGTDDDWPPSATAFRAMCLGVPSLAAVRFELRGREYSRFTRLVWQRIPDPYAFAQADTQRAERIVRDAYQLAREHVMRGGALPDEPVAAIEQAKPEPIKPASPEAVQAAADAVRLVFGS